MRSLSIQSNCTFFRSHINCMDILANSEKSWMCPSPKLGLLNPIISKVPDTEGTKEDKRMDCILAKDMF